MARRTDPTGVDQTCPLLDELLRFIESISLDNQDDEDYQMDCERAEQLVEMIRKANLNLREFGCEQYDQSKEYEKDLKRASDRIDELEFNCKSLGDEIVRLESELESSINN